VTRLTCTTADKNNVTKLKFKVIGDQNSIPGLKNPNANYFSLAGIIVLAQHPCEVTTTLLAALSVTVAAPKELSILSNAADGTATFEHDALNLHSGCADVVAYTTFSACSA